MTEDEKSEGKNEGAPAWMATFADLATLLLTFFVLLLSFASMDIVKFRDAMGSIQESLGFAPAGTGMFQHTTTPPLFDSPPFATSINKSQSKGEDMLNRNEAIISELEDLVKEKGLENDVEIENTKRGVIVRVKGKILFNLGESEIKRESYPILEKIADLMKKFPQKVSIEGHTDNLTIKSGQYSSNWELSTARAFSALKFLQVSKGVDVKRINIAGFADTHPIASNHTSEGRAKNRRVEFVFYEE